MRIAFTQFMQPGFFVRHMIGLCLLFSAQMLWAQCIEVADPGFVREKSELGDVAPTITWWATLSNACDQPFDADLTIDFLDRGGESLYQIRDLATLPVRAEVKVGKTVYLPSTHAGDLQDMRIAVEERERPF